MTVQQWNHRAEVFAENPARMVGWEQHPFDEHERYVKRLLRGLVTPSMKVLDVGCGYGRFAGIVLKRKAEWVGIDFSPAMQQLWKNNGSPGRFVLANAATPPQEAEALGPYDLIFCVGANGPMGLSVDLFCERYSCLIRKPGHIVVVGPYQDATHHYFG